MINPHGWITLAVPGADGQQRAERGRQKQTGDAQPTAAHGVPDGVPDEPAKTLRPSASVTVAALAVFEPSFARYASTVISSPKLSDRLLQPSRIRPFGFDVSIIHSLVLRGYEDPEARCHLPGVPRALDQPGGLYPVQIIQDEKSVALLHEAMHDVRIIPTDNSPHPRNYWAWDGDSRGHWEGDTLVVDVSNFNGRTWLDMQANFVDENERVVERFSLVDRDTIQYEATITDSTVFVRPIQMRFTLKRVPAEQQILEYSCLEGERSLQHYTDEDGGRKRRAQ
jgi:hypothetical protein